MTLNFKLGLFIALFSSAIFLNGCGGNSSPDANTDGSDPASADGSRNGPYPNFKGTDVHGEKNFATLINAYPKAKTTPNLWAGFWWPYKENGIASSAHGSGGSPAGKYDAARGGTTHAQEWEIANHGSKVPKLEGWWGHCNGWCAASALYPEPNKPVKVNGIEFSIADQKALLSEAGMSANADFFGDRVDYGSDFGTSKWFDTVPDQYFLVLTNYIGKLNMGVLIDRYTAEQVWNQPLQGYEIQYPKPADYLGADPAHPDVYRINVTSTIWWAEDGVPPDVQTPPFDFHEDYGSGVELFTPRTLMMEVWLDGPVVFDADGKITSSGNLIVTRQGDSFYGGAWKMGEGYSSEFWPDYMWVPHSLSNPTADLDGNFYGNKDVDYKWIVDHIVSGGVDDPTVHPSPTATPPTPDPSHSPHPTSTPTSTPTWNPFPTPTHSPVHTPEPSHTGNPQPIPGPTHTLTTASLEDAY